MFLFLRTIHGVQQLHATSNRYFSWRSVKTFFPKIKKKIYTFESYWYIWVLFAIPHTNLQMLQHWFGRAEERKLIRQRQATC